METKTTEQTGSNAVKLVGEALLPGASLLMDGNIREGGVHLVLGAVARAFLGPIGAAFVIANSYSKSTTGKNLLKQLTPDSDGRATTKIEQRTVEHKTTTV